MLKGCYHKLMEGGVVMNETELIKKCQKGDTKAFSDLVLKYERRFINYAFKMLKDESLAQDAVQDAFLRIYRKIDTYSGNAAFSTWAYTVLNNICLDILRKKKRTGENTYISINQESKDDEEYEIQIEDNSAEPFDSYKKKAAMEALYSALDEMSEEHREVIVMRDLNGFDYEKIAKITNTSLGTVKSRISRARLALRKILEKDRELFS